ncbi:MAG: helix-turn-helix domain-containing protein [Candidatus Saccharimonadales bacterium]
MKKIEREQAIALRTAGGSIKEIAKTLGVARSSVSVWVRAVELTISQECELKNNSHSLATVEKRRRSRLNNEIAKRELVIQAAAATVSKINNETLRLLGTMLYWAEGGKTQRIVRFSNGDPEMIKIMMAFFRIVCEVPENKFRGYIHIHPHLDAPTAENYWSSISGIPLTQFFKTYTKPNKSSQNKKDSLPYGVFDIYVMDTRLFYRITGWAQGIFSSY